MWVILDDVLQSAPAYAQGLGSLIHGKDSAEGHSLSISDFVKRALRVMSPARGCGEGADTGLCLSCELAP